MLATTVRFVSRRQKRLIREAAQRRNLSVNQFMLENAERAAKRELGLLTRDLDPLVIDKWVESSQESRFGTNSNLQQNHNVRVAEDLTAHNSPSSHDCSCTGECEKEEL